MATREQGASYVKGRLANATGYRPEDIADDMLVYDMVDSIRFVELVAEVEEVLQVQCDDAELAKLQTAGELAEYVAGLCKEGEP